MSEREREISFASANDRCCILVVNFGAFTESFIFRSFSWLIQPSAGFGGRLSLPMGKLDAIQRIIECRAQSELNVRQRAPLVA